MGFVTLYKRRAFVSLALCRATALEGLPVMSDNIVKQLPKTRQEMMAFRKSGFSLTLNDRVEALHLRLFPDQSEVVEGDSNSELIAFQDRYLLLLDAVYDEQSVEGTIAADNQEAARVLREFARGAGKDSYVSEQKLITLSRALGVVLRRYGMSRKERAHTVGGEVMSNGN